MRAYKTRWRDFYFICQEVHAILRCLNRQDELRRLIEWADNKRLPDPHTAYTIKLDDTNRKLFRYRVSSPRLTMMARHLHSFKTLLTPFHYYLPEGSASMYRRSKA